MFWRNIPKDTIKFILLIILSIGFTYYLPKLFASIWYILLLVMYYRSKDEAFWFVFFLVTVDGFMGFFGVYSVVIQAIPGLPAIEVAQLYILLSVIKAVQVKKHSFIFFKRFLIILSIYIIFLVFWGQMMGFTGEFNAYFRIFKSTLPFLLFFSIPRLFLEMKVYERMFGFIFLILLLAFFTQVFNIITGFSPAGAIELTNEEMVDAGAFRGFYNVIVTLLGLLGGLFFLMVKRYTVFQPYYLYGIVFTAFAMAFLSATRGWILGFGLIIFLSLISTPSSKVIRILGLFAFAIIFYFFSISNPKIRQQLAYSQERLWTLEALAEGDITAEGTLSRLSERGPRVLSVWKENPLFGWGFSDKTREFADSHVGNQTLLLTSGIVGFVLLIGFMIFFLTKMLLAYFEISNSYNYKKGFIVLSAFLVGWFVIHSTSGQFFNYSGIPFQVMPQAVYFSFGALLYSKSKEFSHVQKIRKSTSALHK